MKSKYFKTFITLLTIILSVSSSFANVGVTVPDPGQFNGTGIYGVNVTLTNNMNQHLEYGSGATFEEVFYKFEGDSWGLADYAAHYLKREGYPCAIIQGESNNGTHDYRAILVEINGTIYRFESECATNEDNGWDISKFKEGTNQTVLQTFNNFSIEEGKEINDLYINKVSDKAYVTNLFNEMITVNGEKVHKYVFGIGTNSIAPSRTNYTWGEYYLTAVKNYDPQSKKWGVMRFALNSNPCFAGIKDNDLIEGHFFSCMGLGGNDGDFDVPTGKNHAESFEDLEGPVYKLYLGSYGSNYPLKFTGDTFLDPRDYIKF
ncbi:MAG: hypothetical protein LBV42_03400 [Methanobrevibacter sp.]|jgi:hypothetical protein|nr:hypothetical protein [Methanobrevibacter sp.]